MLGEPPRDPDDRSLPPAAVLGSVLLHTVAGLLLLRTAPGLATPPPPDTYRVKLVAAAAEEAPVRQDPRPAEAAEEEHRPPPPEPTERPKPETETPKVEKEEEPRREPDREPARTAEEGEDPVNVQLEGANFPFPDYLETIIRQVNRYWRPPTGVQHLRAELSFVVHEDGSVSDIEWVRRSGNTAFDLEARGAVEAAGRRKAFGPLPEEYPRDRLRVSFFFDPTVF